MILFLLRSFISRTILLASTRSSKAFDILCLIENIQYFLYKNIYVIYLFNGHFLICFFIYC